MEIIVSSQTSPRRTVAVITRTKDRPLLLGRCCTSVIGQTYVDWQHVIVNDGGERESVEQVLSRFSAQYGERLTIIHNEHCIGMEAASNVGIAASNSDYIAVLDDDDSWAPTFLQECITFLNTLSNGGDFAGVVTQSMLIEEEIRNEHIRIINRQEFNPWLKAVNLFRLCVGNVFTSNAAVFRRSVWEELGGFNETLPVLGDWEFNLRVSSRWELGVIAKPLAYYHQRTGLSDARYVNTVLHKVDEHVRIDNLIRNRLLREDLQKGHIGLGLLVNLSMAIEQSNEGINYVKRWARRVLRPTKWARIILGRVSPGASRTEGRAPVSPRQHGESR
ncbi:MAG: glycosyltransferase [Desulfomonile sp.]|nr:glycosyltransferase [Desulfomonile sp.]